MCSQRHVTLNCRGNNKCKYFAEEKESAEQFWHTKGRQPSIEHTGVFIDPMKEACTEIVTEMKNNIMMHFMRQLEKFIRNEVDPEKKYKGAAKAYIIQRWKEEREKDHPYSPVPYTELEALFRERQEENTLINPLLLEN